MLFSRQEMVYARHFDSHVIIDLNKNEKGKNQNRHIICSS